MIHIKCKKCGWRLPFSSKINGYTVRGKIKGEKLICPNCGEVLIIKRKKQ